MTTADAALGALLWFSLGTAVTSECILELQNIDPILTADDSLILPHGKTGVPHLAEGEELVISCPGDHNQLLVTHSTESKGVCLRNGTLQVEGNDVGSSELGCEKHVTPVALDTERRCGYKNDFQEFSLGYTVDDTWYGLVDVCHDVYGFNTLYSQHSLIGAVLPDIRPSSQRPSFLAGGGPLYESFSPSRAFTGDAVLDSLTRHLGSKDIASSYLNVTSLSRGHLAPSGDFVLKPHQHATFFYINTAPQWQSFNGGNWLSVETRVRNYASQTAKNLSIITGTFGVLRLPDQNDIPREIFLGPPGSRKLAVPKFFWKVVYDSQTGEGIVFVGINNPFLSKVLLEDLLCPNVCNGSGWAPRKGKWRRLSKGYVYCCEVESFRRAVKNVPLIDVTSILRGPRAMRKRRHLRWFRS